MNDHFYGNIGMVRDTISHTKDMINSIETDMQDIRHIMKQKVQYRSDTEQLVQLLQVENDCLKTKIQFLENEENRQEERTTNALNTLQSEYTEKILILEGEIERILTQYNEISHVKDVLESEIEQKQVFWSSQVHALQTEKQELFDKLQDMERYNQRIEHEVAVLTDDKNTLMKQKTWLQTKNEELAQEVAYNEQALQAVRQENDQFQQEIIPQYQQQVQQLEQEKAQLVEAVQQHQQQSQHYQEAYQQMTFRYQHLVEAAEKEENEMSHDLIHAEDRIQELEDNNDRLYEEIQALKEQLAAAQAEVVSAAQQQQQQQEKELATSSSHHSLRSGHSRTTPMDIDHYDYRRSSSHQSASYHMPPPVSHNASSRSNVIGDLPPPAATTTNKSPEAGTGSKKNVHLLSSPSGSRSYRASHAHHRNGDIVSQDDPFYNYPSPSNPVPTSKRFKAEESSALGVSQSKPFTLSRKDQHGSQEQSQANNLHSSGIEFTSSELNDVPMVVSHGVMMRSTDPFDAHEVYRRSHVMSVDSDLETILSESSAGKALPKTFPSSIQDEHIGMRKSIDNPAPVSKPSLRPSNSSLIHSNPKLPNDAQSIDSTHTNSNIAKEASNFSVPSLPTTSSQSSSSVVTNATPTPINAAHQQPTHLHPTPAPAPVTIKSSTSEIANRIYGIRRPATAFTISSSNTTSSTVATIGSSAMHPPAREENLVAKNLATIPSTAASKPSPNIHDEVSSVLTGDEEEVKKDIFIEEVQHYCSAAVQDLDVSNSSPTTIGSFDPNIDEDDDHDAKDNNRMDVVVDSKKSNSFQSKPKLPPVEENLASSIVRPMHIEFQESKRPSAFTLNRSPSKQTFLTQPASSSSTSTTPENVQDDKKHSDTDSVNSTSSSRIAAARSKFEKQASTNRVSPLPVSSNQAVPGKLNRSSPSNNSVGSTGSTNSAVSKTNSLPSWVKTNNSATSSVTSMSTTSSMNEEKVMPQRSDRFDHPVKIPSIKKRHTVTLGAVPSSDSSITSTNITIASTANNAPSSVASAATAMESEPMSVQEDDERLTLNDLHHPSTTNIMIEVTYPPLPTEPYDATITQPPLPAEPFDLVAASPKHARVRLTNNHDGYLTPSSDEDDFSPSGRYKVPAYMTAHLPNVNANKHLPGVLSPSHDVIAQSTPTDVSTYNDLFNFDEANVKLSDLLNIDVGK